MFLPNTITSPDDIVTKDEIIPITVDLPAPLGPKKAKISPFFTDKFIFSRAITLFL